MKTLLRKIYHKLFGFPLGKPICPVETFGVVSYNGNDLCLRLDGNGYTQYFILSKECKAKHLELMKLLNRNK